MSINWPEIDDWVDRARIHEGSPGLQYAVTDRDGLLREAAFGFADIASQTPMTSDHLLETGSIGKSFTALALLQLADEGKLDVHAPVTDYLPWFEVQSEFEPITLHHLLSHGAAISAGVDFAPAAEIQVWDLRNQRTSAAPGTMFHYSNVGYKVLGLVLQAITGQRYGQSISERVLEPLGLEASVAEISSADRERLATGYSPTFDDRPWWPGRPLSPATWLETDTADGCLAQPARELAAYLRMLMNRGEGPAGRLLSEEGFAQFSGRHNAIEDDSQQTAYGYGLITWIEDDHRMLGHMGGMVGYFSAMRADMDSGLGVTVLVNGPGGPNWIAKSILGYLRANAEGAPFEFPPLDDEQEPISFQGRYRPLEGTDEPLEMISSSSGPRVQVATRTLELHPIDDGAFGIVDDDFGRFPLVFAPQPDGSSLVHCGPRSWVSEASSLANPAPFQIEWQSYVGQYRSHNPWLTGFRVYIRDGRLRLFVPSEPDGLEMDQPLVQLGEGNFRAGDDPLGPELIRFDTMIDGKTTRAILVTSEYYRVQAP